MRDMAAMADLDIDQLAAEAREGDKTLEEFKQDMDQYNAEQAKFTALPQHTFLGLVKLNSEKMRAALLPAPAACLAELHALLPKLGFEKVTALAAHVNEANLELTKELQTVDEFAFTLTFRKAQGRQDDLQAAYSAMEDHFELMTNESIDVPATTRPSISLFA